MTFEEIINGDNFDKNQIITMLTATGDDRKKLFEKANEIKKKYVGNKVYFRGLIEYSNICAKNCYYCGIRRSNENVSRYCLSEEEVIGAARFAYEKNYGSVVIQSGELSSPDFVNRIDRLIKEIKKLSNGTLGMTLSLGEQTEETYKRWFDSGAHRYLLRIESSNRELYQKIHPNDSLHSYDTRLKTLELIKKLGYQVGTGVMVGLPFQTIDHLVDDLLFMRDFDIDMCGMGPYIEHKDTPLYEFREGLMPLNERMELTIKMIASLRIIMKNINIASTTALQAIDKVGREKGIMVGANIIMPNITPGKYRDNYLLYENKPCTDEEAEDCVTCLEARIHMAGAEIGYGEWGDSKHFVEKNGF